MGAHARACVCVREAHCVPKMHSHLPHMHADTPNGVRPCARACVRTCVRTCVRARRVQTRSRAIKRQTDKKGKRGRYFESLVSDPSKTVAAKKCFRDGELELDLPLACHLVGDVGYLAKLFQLGRVPPPRAGEVVQPTVHASCACRGASAACSCGAVRAWCAVCCA